MAAAQALPILRSAANEDAATQDAALRRLGVVREVLHALTTPKFGKRDLEPTLPTPEERHRQMLGLPFDRGLTLAEIHRAYKRAAKTAHPDAGGNAQAFLELTAARDALMHPGAKKGDDAPYLPQNDCVRFVSELARAPHQIRDLDRRPLLVIANLDLELAGVEHRLGESDMREEIVGGLA